MWILCAQLTSVIIIIVISCIKTFDNIIWVNTRIFGLMFREIKFLYSPKTKSIIVSNIAAITYWYRSWSHATVVCSLSFYIYRNSHLNFYCIVGLFLSEIMPIFSMYIALCPCQKGTIALYSFVDRCSTAWGKDEALSPHTTTTKDRSALFTRLWSVQ